MKEKKPIWWQENRNKVYLLVVLLLLVAIVGFVNKMHGKEQVKETMVQKPAATAEATPTLAVSPTPGVATPKPEEAVYSYLQGPKSWSRRIAWSGYWGEAFMDGGSFGGFGCGLCCIANVYSSITPYRCTPVQAYEYAKKHTGYGGGGAIDWGYMRRTLNKLGMDCKVKKKPGSYKKFQSQIAQNPAAIVLVSSANSTCFWKDTPGHYVTIFLYNEETDKVFLADSGEPKRNRRWVSLKKVYQSLKTASSWQMLLVKSYDSTKDQWKHKTAGGNWIHTK